ncbi:hypothetical protein [Herminiimonas sp. CN]|uniref:hypothetical protein n=1 Tax=Herminiimonas sp. CN TaxID=1349818 RepID=UPI00047421A9|nr:hypothetical protein [Herminiimonas sp. CN]
MKKTEKADQWPPAAGSFTKIQHGFALNLLLSPYIALPLKPPPTPHASRLSSKNINSKMLALKYD